MAALPLLCFLIETAWLRRRPRMRFSYGVVFCRWFVFWALGIRLFTAGLMQLFLPDFTAGMLQLPDSAYIVVNELGIANLMLGLTGVGTLFWPSWRKPAAFAAGFFLLGCALLHVLRIGIGPDFKENVALISDFWAFLVGCFALFQRPDRR